MIARCCRQQIFTLIQHCDVLFKILKHIGILQRFSNIHNFLNNNCFQKSIIFKEILTKTRDWHRFIYN